MRRRDLGRLVGWVAALLIALLLAAMVPATSSAFTAMVTNSSDTAATKATFTCADVFRGDARRRTAYFEYTFSEQAGAATAADSSAQGNTGTYEGTNAKDGASPRSCPADQGSPYLLDGASRVTTSTYFPPIRQDFSIEVWFKTTAISEKVMGFEATQTGNSQNYDKHFYVDDAGHLRYAVFDGNTNTVVSPNPVNDGVWHQAVATTSSDGSVLYIDGAEVGRDPSKVLAENFSGYWRIGQGATGGWPNAPSYSFFTGSLAFAAAYGQVLSASEVRSAYRIGRPGPASVATATPVPETTATAVAAPDAPAQTAQPASPSPVQTAQATVAPAPASGPDISTAQ